MCTFEWSMRYCNGRRVRNGCFGNYWWWMSIMRMIIVAIWMVQWMVVLNDWSGGHDWSSLYNGCEWCWIHNCWNNWTLYNGWMVVCGQIVVMMWIIINDACIIFIDIWMWCGNGFSMMWHNSVICWCIMLILIGMGMVIVMVFGLVNGFR